MRLPYLFASVVLVASAFAQVKIEPPSPYMSSPPPSQADTTVIDPGRKPNCETQLGLAEAWYADWNLTTDRPSSPPLENKAPRRSMPTFRVAFDDNGWPTEVVYYDAKARPRWTKLFRYPARIPAGPGVVPYTVSWIGSNGKAILMSKVADAFKAAKWALTMKKYDVSDALGEPLLIEVNSVGTTFSANAETWVYWIDGQEARFTFDKDNKLTELPKLGAAPVKVQFEPEKPAPAVVAAPTPVVKPAVDTVKPKAPEAKPAPASTKAVEAPKPSAVKADTTKTKPVDAAKVEAAKTDSAKAKAPAAAPAPRYNSKAKMIEDKPKKDTAKAK